MATEVGTAYLSLSLSTRGLAPDIKRQFGQVEASAEATGKKAGGLFGGRLAGAANSGLGIVAKTVASIGIAKLGTDAIRVGLQTASGMEKSRIAFTTMLGSASKADALIRQMTEFAATTPFEMQGLQTSASQLVAAGVSSDKIIPIMRTLGDVTSGMGTGSEGISRATVALQQMNAAQKISGEDLNQLRDAGIPVYDLLASALGKSKGEVVDLAQKGKLGKDALDKMMSALTSGKGLEKFNGLMQKQSQSLDGMMSNLSDTFSQGMATAIQPLLPQIKDFVSKVTNWLPGALKSVADIISNDIVPAISWVMDNSGWIGPLVGLIAGIAAAIKVATVVQWLWNAALDANPIGLIIIAIAALVAGLVWFFTQTDVGRKAWSTFVGWLVGAWNWVANSAKGIWEAVSGFFSGLWSGITSFATNSWNGFLQWLTGLWNSFVMANLLIWDTLSSFFSGLWSGITSFATNAWNGLVNWMTGLFRAHVAAVRTIWGAITGFFSGLWNGIKTTAQSVWNGLVSWFTGIPGKITSALGNMGSLLSQKGRDLINGLVNGAKGIWSSVTGWFGGIGGKILSAIGQANSILFNAGKSIIDGFFNGLKDSWKNVTDFVGGIASWIAANKGPISYDATLLVGHGRAIMQGLDSGLQSENGWRSTVAGVADSISGMSASLTGSTVAAAGAGDVYVQNPFTGEYLLARVGDVSRKEMAATARRAR